MIKSQIGCTKWFVQAIILQVSNQIKSCRNVNELERVGVTSRCWIVIVSAASFSYASQWGELSYEYQSFNQAMVTVNAMWSDLSLTEQSHLIQSPLYDQRGPDCSILPTTWTNASAKYKLQLQQRRLKQQSPSLPLQSLLQDAVAVYASVATTAAVTFAAEEVCKPSCKPEKCIHDHQTTNSGKKEVEAEASNSGN
jgi:hypothetical protein